jgi:hypothetical protein
LAANPPGFSICAPPPHIPTPNFANKSLVGDSIRSDDRPIASAPVDTTLRQLRVRFFDMSGHELKNNLMVSMWFSLLTD